MPKLLSRLAAWSIPITRTRIIAFTVALGTIIFGMAVLIDRVLMQECSTLVYVTNGILALAVSLLFLSRNIYLKERLEVIAGLNHDVRNALHAISLSMSLQSPNVQIINDSVDRIDRALREFVPQRERRKQERGKI